MRFSEFVSSLVTETLHPELLKIVQDRSTYKTKQSRLAAMIRHLAYKGEPTGIESNMPKGSSRAFMLHTEPENIILDGKPASIKSGTKVAITATLDKHHNKIDFGGLSLGEMQNKAENGDRFVNNNYRVFRQKKDGTYESNNVGIFPPLFDHDYQGGKWSHIGQARDIKPNEFQLLTRTKEFPKGITHADFVDVLQRFHDWEIGKYWTKSAEREAYLNRLEEHPLVKHFEDYHENTGSSPADYQQRKNMGVFEFPDGTKKIVARDHGFSTEVAHAYRQARLRGAFGDQTHSIS